MANDLSPPVPESLAGRAGRWLFWVFCVVQGYTVVACGLMLPIRFPSAWLADETWRLISHRGEWGVVSIAVILGLLSPARNLPGAAPCWVWHARRWSVLTLFLLPGICEFAGWFWQLRDWAVAGKLGAGALLIHTGFGCCFLLLARLCPPRMLYGLAAMACSLIFLALCKAGEFLRFDSTAGFVFRDVGFNRFLRDPADYVRGLRLGDLRHRLTMVDPESNDLFWLLTAVLLAAIAGLILQYLLGRRAGWAGLVLVCGIGFFEWSCHDWLSAWQGEIRRGQGIATVFTRADQPAGDELVPRSRVPFTRGHVSVDGYDLHCWEGTLDLDWRALWIPFSQWRSKQLRAVQWANGAGDTGRLSGPEGDWIFPAGGPGDGPLRDFLQSHGSVPAPVLEDTAASMAFQCRVLSGSQAGVSAGVNAPLPQQESGVIYLTQEIYQHEFLGAVDLHRGPRYLIAPGMALHVPAGQAAGGDLELRLLETPFRQRYRVFLVGSDKGKLVVKELSVEGHYNGGRVGYLDSVPFRAESIKHYFGGFRRRYRVSCPESGEVILIRTRKVDERPWHVKVPLAP